MNRPIALLPPEVANQIAAGEVIERPASVVKELIENAIDAGARRIQVEVRGGGAEWIAVQDDGSGIPADQAALAFERHATSKVRAAADLAAIGTLGFRGEALPSIAAVATVEMRTRVSGEEAGCLVRVQANSLSCVEPCAAPEGTLVVARDLFFNTPARLKFLKSAVAEKRAIADYVAHIALSRPGVAFTLKADGKDLFHSPGDGRLLSVAAAVYGPQVAGRLISIAADESRAHRPVVSGLIGVPADGRATRTGQAFFVNGRWIHSRLLSAALEKGYATLLMVRRFPIAALHIRLDPAAVDVNVHPAKAEVRFRDESELFRAVWFAVRAALAAANLIPGSRAAEAPLAEAPASAAGACWAGRAATEAARNPGWEPRPLFWSGAATAAPRPEPVWIPARIDLQADRVAEAPAAETPASPAETPPPPLAGLLRVGPGPRHWEQPRAAALTATFARERLRSARILGQLSQTYILGQAGAALWLIDQHAAHERILYERLLRRGGEPASQPLLAPIPIPLSAAQAVGLAASLPDLAALGFELVPFGPQAWAARALPFGLSPAEAEAALQETIEEALDVWGKAGAARRERLAAMMACRAAVKAGDRLLPESQERLLWDLSHAEMPFTCPHGRPIVVEIGPEEIERRFGRR